MYLLFLLLRALLRVRPDVFARLGELSLQTLNLRGHLRPRRRRSLTNRLLLFAHRLQRRLQTIVFDRHAPHLPVERRLRLLQPVGVFPRLSQRFRVRDAARSRRTETIVSSGTPRPRSISRARHALRLILHRRADFRLRGVERILHPPRSRRVARVPLDAFATVDLPSFTRLRPPRRAHRASPSDVERRAPPPMNSL